MSAVLVSRQSLSDAALWATHAADMGKAPSPEFLGLVELTYGAWALHPGQRGPVADVPALTLACTDRYRVAWATAAVESEVRTEGDRFTVKALDLIRALRSLPPVPRRGAPTQVELSWLGAEHLTLATLGASVSIDAARTDFPNWRAFAVVNPADMRHDGPVVFDPAYLGQAATVAAKLWRTSNLRITPNGLKPALLTPTAHYDGFRASALLMPVRAPS